MTTQEQIAPGPNKSPRPDMILGVEYEEYKPETYAGIRLEPLMGLPLPAKTFHSGQGFEADLEDAEKYLKSQGLTAVCRSSFDHYQTDRKASQSAKVKP